MKAFQILGIPPNSTVEQVNDAFRKKRRLAHPDKGGSSDEFLELMKAYRDALMYLSPKVCPECEGTGKIRVRTGATIEKQNCPRCWKGK